MSTAQQFLQGGPLRTILFPINDSMATSGRQTRPADTLEMEQWLEVNETAKAILQRETERRLPSLTPMAPLHRVALHGGHVLEIAGPSGSGKSELLLQAVVSCILPKEWEGLSIGGSEKPTVYLDLDCRFDMIRLVHLLKCRIYKVQDALNNRSSVPRHSVEKRGLIYGRARQEFSWGARSMDNLIRKSLNRLYLKRCYNSFEFLCALKTTRPHLKHIAAEHGGSAHLLIIDSIGAFYWLDRGTQTTSGEAGRQTLSLQTISGGVVNELRQLGHTYPLLLIMATKAIIHKNFPKDSSGSKRLNCEVPIGSKGEDEFSLKNSALNDPEGPGRSSHREYMPAAWREFVSHRLLLDGPYQSGLPHTEEFMSESLPSFTAEWDKPLSTHRDHFVIQDDGIKLTNEAKS